MPGRMISVEIPSKRSSRVRGCTSNQMPHLSLSLVWLKYPAQSWPKVVVSFVCAQAGRAAAQSASPMITLYIMFFLFKALLVKKPVYRYRCIVQRPNHRACGKLDVSLVKNIGSAQ